MTAPRSPDSRNRTLTCSADDTAHFSAQILSPERATSVSTLENQIIKGDFFQAVEFLPLGFVDLLILDPPYNLTKTYNTHIFSKKSTADYADWFERIIVKSLPLLKPDASIYVCADWQSSIIIAPILGRHFTVQNRITWERDKGRGALRNWKNNSEDIWFCTMGDDFYFDVDSVKMKRRVLAPYKANGNPKDWQAEGDGNFRITHPSNLWTDISIPFWSMAENTPHPTQKPEKLLAKMILASCPEGGFVFDPFAGSGTTPVVAEKLGRRYSGIEQDLHYCCLALKRLHRARSNRAIQGYNDGVFWERNSLAEQKKSGNGASLNANQQGLF